MFHKPHQTAISNYDQHFLCQKYTTHINVSFEPPCLALPRIVKQCLTEICVKRSDKVGETENNWERDVLVLSQTFSSLRCTCTIDLATQMVVHYTVYHNFVHHRASHSDG